METYSVFDVLSSTFTAVQEGVEPEAFCAQHLQLNHWLGNHAYTSPLTSVVPYMPILHDFHPGMSGEILISDEPTHTPAALQLRCIPGNSSQAQSCSQQQSAAVVDFQVSATLHAMAISTLITVLDPSMLYGPLTSHVFEAIAAQQSVVQTSVVSGESWLNGMCWIEDKPTINKSLEVNSGSIGACLTGRCFLLNHYHVIV